jgi:glycosyltransferase involved in cell wall biosynthesis
MRITLVLPAFNLSGGIRVFAIYADRLRRRGHEVLAVAPRESAPTFAQAVRSFLRGRGWPTAPGKLPSHFDGLAVEHRLLDHPGPVTDADLPDADVVIGGWWETVRWVADLSPAKGAKVHFVQGYEVFAGDPEEVDAVYRLPLPKIVVSAWLRDLMRNKFGREPVALIPNSVETDKFHAPPRGKQARPTVGLVYNTMRIKGCDISIKAYELAAREVPDLQLVSMSELPVSDQLPLPKTAVFICRARDQALRETYARCDAWLSGTREEGFGLPILEAMACRTPVIATPAGAAPELLGKGGGILVPPEDPGAMARAIEQVCSLPDAEWRALSDAALATATSFSWDDATGQMEQALTTIAERFRSGKAT